MAGNPSEATAEQLTEVGKGFLPGLCGVRFTGAGQGWIEAELPVRQEVMAPNGFLHAASIIALADSACGYGCMRAIPEGAAGFTTIELKTNFLGTARDGTVTVRGEAKHLGRTTQLWDAEVKHRETGRTIALFRCTQLVLWPK